MSLENEILDALEDLKYPGIPAEDSLLAELTTFSAIISWLSKQLQKLIPTCESIVDPIKGMFIVLNLLIIFSSMSLS